MSCALIHRVTIVKQGRLKGTAFQRCYELPFATQNGLRISLGEEASFTVEDLVFHVDAGTFSCRTTVETSGESPLDDVLSYYQRLGYNISPQKPGK